jgi:hypothetical protein
MKYFIEYSNDEVIPASGSDKLVEEYAKLMNENDKYVPVFETKDDLMDEALEYAGYARHGARGFEKYSDKEMRDLIEEEKDQLVADHYFKDHSK